MGLPYHIFIVYWVRSYKIMLPLPKLTMIMFRRFLIIANALLSSAWVCAQGTDYRATYYVDGAEKKDQFRSHTSLESVEQGGSVVYATNGVDLILTKMRLNKTSGSISDTDRRETGRNSVILADGGSKVLLEFCDVVSHIPQSDGITAKGSGTKVTVQEGSIGINRLGGAAVNVVSGGVVELNETNVSTNAWALCNVDGGSVTFNDCILKEGGVCGFLLYGAQRNDGQGTLDLNKNMLTISDGPMFLVTNTSALITMTGNKINGMTDELLSVKADYWGTAGANGGKASLILKKQTISGDIKVDSISSLELKLQKGARFNGHINQKENRCAHVSVKIESGAVWTVKGESYLTSIEFAKPIKKGLKQLKGKHVIYYDPDDAANAPLGGREYKTGGGILRPLR